MSTPSPLCGCWGLLTAGRKTARGRGDLSLAIRPLVLGLGPPNTSEHQLVAVVCALTAQLWRDGRTHVVGDLAEGMVIIPELL
ncbi:hypothetical protein V5E97_09640 [Singulisphaera sp. Ch08]|uniref:Uncharacterized protein n=1 Tax=Singulisphaera sp. Ch08 TaxID=3120278 RepID=A0AAU7CMQ1_9BACT